MTRRDNFRLGLALLALVRGFAPLGIRAQTPPEITAVFPQTHRLNLTWTPPPAGQVYSVQQRDSLRDGVWLTRSDLRPWPTPLAQWEDSAGGFSQAGFFQVIAVPAAERGKVLSAALIQAVTTNEIALFLALAGSTLQPQFAVDVHKLQYETVDPLGGRTLASGLVVVPQHPGRALPLVSYQHGTLVVDGEVPSATLTLERVVGIALAATGYAAVIPDYLGLGDSPGLHPYHHARSEATACVDLLRAARTWSATNGVALTDQLFLCGYSEGGYVTLALQRELESFHTDEFTVTASAPMAGAYDLSGTTLQDALSGRPMPNPYYFGLLLAAYQDVYHLTDSLSEWLTPPYHLTLPPLLTGTNDGGQINAAMPSVVTNVFQPAVLAALKTNPRHPMRAALQDNDLYRWTPRAPLRLYHCSGDLDVVAANSQVAYDSFRSRGATRVELVDPWPLGDHGDCALPSLESAKAWFDSLRD